MMDKLKLSWVRYRESLIILVRKYYANCSANLSPHIDMYFKKVCAKGNLGQVWYSEKASAVKFRLPL